MPMTKEQLCAIQAKTGLNDTKFSVAIGITRQTWRNWKVGKPMPQFAENALRWLDELCRVDPGGVAEILQRQSQ